MHKRTYLRFNHVILIKNQVNKGKRNSKTYEFCSNNAGFCSKC